LEKEQLYVLGAIILAILSSFAEGIDKWEGYAAIWIVSSLTLITFFIVLPYDLKLRRQKAEED